MPKPMNYAMSGIVCLANDLKGSADDLQAKRVLAGDEAKAMVTYYPMVPAWEWHSNSRLIVVAHGNPESTHIIGDMGQWDAKKLAEWIASWLKKDISRISLHMCYGGGNRGKAEGGNVGAFDVHPSRSFGYKFASYCSLATTVTARTNWTAIDAKFNPDSGLTTSVRRVVGGADRHHKEGDKVVFFTQGGTPDKPVDPKMKFTYRANA